MSQFYALTADAVLVLHAGFVAFVVLGLVLIVAGGRLGWRWVQGRLFRYGHLAAIAVVVLQAWFGVLCPLTTLEYWLRERAGQAHAQGSFIQHWLQELLYYRAPAWVFVLVYTLFALVVVWAWWRYPPRER